MAYELVKTIRRFVQEGIGDTARLEYILDRLEKGKDLYSSDKKYLENLLYENEAIASEQTETMTELHSLAKLETDLRNLNIRLEHILKNKQRDGKIKSDHDMPVAQTQQKSKSAGENTVRHKNEQATLVLAVVLGLVSLQGIGHIYIGKIARGAGILVFSLFLTVLGILYVVEIMPKSSILSTVSIYLIPVLVVGYLGLYIFQVLDSRKLCVEYNQYISEQGKRPPWW